MEVGDGGLSPSPIAQKTGGTMLIDTGAQVSVLDLDVALSLDLPEIRSSMSIQGVAGRSKARLFSGLLHLPEWDLTFANTFVSLPLQEQHSVLALIGMDVLGRLILTLDGPNNSIAISGPSNPKQI